MSLLLGLQAPTATTSGVGYWFVRGRAMVRYIRFFRNLRTTG